ncbi:argininosuccinate lyase [Evansella vedderi]|uniref:Argininosuccinate lyase n=1 Tax=Evansella vedderi TaxID=38282 RepID=A0ABT9ZQ18_9BACI|nr:argininosuccinate lyase [Evansella vedderi]MDQ0253335.1 argininosuccinate lyase [Evansella vedderi]
MSVTRSQNYIETTLEPTYNFTRNHFYNHIMEINLAHVLMLKKQSILPKDEAETILKATYELYKEGYSKNYNASFEDLFFMVEADLAEEIGPDLVGNMHIAFSRNDMDTTMFRMFWREKLAKWIEKINDLRVTILELVAEHKATVMPAHTHNQQAQPTTLAHYLMAVENNLRRDVQRGIALYERMNHSPMGAAALATTGFPIDRQFMSDRLGFERPMSNSYDAISASDFMLELSSVLTISLSTISRFVFDLIFMTTNEVNTLRLHEKHVQTSSIMPQKRNPSALEHTRASISKALGKLQGATIIAHNVPLGDIVDIGDDIQPSLLSGYNDTNDILIMLSEILQECSFNKETLYENAQSGFSTVTELADVLVRKHHVSFRKAHAIVSDLVNELVSNTQGITDGNAEQVRIIAREKFNLLLSLTDEEYKQATDALDFVNIRNILGGPSPSEVERQRIEAWEVLQDNQNWVTVTLHNLNNYSSKLEKEVELCVNNKN